MLLSHDDGPGTRVVANDLLQACEHNLPLESKPASWTVRIDTWNRSS